MSQLFPLALYSIFLAATDVPPAPMKGQPVVLQQVQLTDHHGNRIKPSSFGKGPLLVNFIFTRCPMACPVQTRELAKIWRALPSDVQASAQFLSISVDPANDTPEKLAAYASRMATDIDGWRFATGDPAQVNQLLKRMRILDPSKPNPQPLDHTLNLYLFDPTGTLIITYNGAPVDRTRLIEELTQLTRMRRQAR
jgi:protein SCO1